MNDFERQRLEVSRRAFLGQSALGLGAAALASLAPKLASAEPASGADAGVLGALRHVSPKAKRVIFLYMSGGPSHLETFDYKPTLEKLHDQPMPESFTQGQPIAQLQGQK